MSIKMRRGSDNVFADLGFDPEEAEHLRVRSDLMIELTKLIQAKGMTQTEAATSFGVTQPRIQRLDSGKGRSLQYQFPGRLARPRWRLGEVLDETPA